MHQVVHFLNQRLTDWVWLRAKTWDALGDWLRSQLSCHAARCQDKTVARWVLLWLLILLDFWEIDAML